MEEMKETREAILALVVLGKFVADRLKDGAQIEDAIALGQKLSDEAFKAKVMAGIEGLDKVALEMKDMSMPKLLELAKVLPDIVAELSA